MQLSLAPEPSIYSLFDLFAEFVRDFLRSALQQRQLSLYPANLLANRNQSHPTTLESQADLTLGKRSLLQIALNRGDHTEQHF